MYSKSGNEFSKNDQINFINNNLSHIVILGAGASIASTIDADEKNGKKLPSMDNFFEALNIKKKYSEILKGKRNKNLEKIYGELIKENPVNPLVFELENDIYQYFSSLELPNSPTIYDYLILSLRSKDVIATFNWDPFLEQAYIRNLRFTRDLPQLLFLHGNVAIGVCDKDRTFGVIGAKCSKCNEKYQPVKLLYPVEEKNYNSTPFIKAQWDTLIDVLKRPVMITFFGYSAPKSDVEAIKLMRNAHSQSKIRQFDEIEVIDIKTEDIIYKTWKPFFYSHHYSIVNNFFNSSFAKFPRRTCEVYWAEKMEALFCEDNKHPKFTSLNWAWDWFSELIAAEYKYGRK